MLSIASCMNYEEKAVYAAAKAALEDIGGLAKNGVLPGMRVLIKPNLIRAMAPEQHATTHPSLIRAVCLLVREAGAEPLVAESPGGPYNAGLLRSVYNTCGVTALCAREDIPLCLETEVYRQSIEGRALRDTEFIAPLREVDAVINLPKCKTHGLTLYSGAVKNLFGLVPGTAKAQAHYRFSNPADFLDMLLDIYEYVNRRPLLHVMDAITGMEGNGPTSGSPRDIGCVIAGNNGLELDSAASEMIGITDLPLLARAAERGLWQGARESRGEDISAFRQDFTIPTGAKGVELVGIKALGNFKPLYRLAQYFLRPRPLIRDNCVGCGICVRDCPAHTIRIVKGKARIDASECIYCYCCQELCPHHAVDIKPSPAYRLLR